METIKRVSRKNLHYTFADNIEPAVYANSNDTLVFECVDCYCNQIVDENTVFANVNTELNNPATGPVYIEGAKKGDILKVSILKIDLPNKGVMTIRPGAGLYGDHLDEYRSKAIKVENNTAHFNDTIKIPLIPMIGVIGVAPHDEIESTWPGEHGGNIDCKDLTEGTAIYLPVYTDGALLSMGDIHGVQGDGETVICALEMDGIVTVRVEVLKNRTDIPTPFIVTKDRYITTYAAETLDKASEQAAIKMLYFLKCHSDLTIEDCAMLLSLSGNLRISQVVNDLKGGLMDFPIGLIGEKVEL